MATPNRKNELPTPVDLRRLPRHDTNPLVAPQRVKLGVRKRAATGIDVNDVATTTTVVTDELVDATTFVKVYDAGIRAAFDLSKAAAKVYQLVLQITGQGPRNADMITLHPSILEASPIKMSEDTYWRGMRELIAKKFLAAYTIPHRYWLNPHFFVKGSTLTIVRRYEIAAAEAQKVVPASQPAALPPSLFDD